MDAVALETKIEALERELVAQADKHNQEMQELQGELQELTKFSKKIEEDILGDQLSVISGPPNNDVFTRRIEWTIDNFADKDQKTAKWTSIWSPKFNAAGMESLQFEFFPKGREKTSYPGFCSLFLWCPSGTKIRYQLWVGSFLRAPDEDEYTGRIGHGHSNFCPLEPEVNRDADTLTVGVNFLEIMHTQTLAGGCMQLTSVPIERMISNQADVWQNRSVDRVVWKITNVMGKRTQELPKGQSLWSRLFTAAGIPDMLLEFYPNGTEQTQREGFCGFYIRCPRGVTIVVKLFVGKVEKGPIKTTFDNLTGKGLPDFCLLRDEVAEDDSVEVGIQISNQPVKSLTFETS